MVGVPPMLNTSALRNREHLIALPGLEIVRARGVGKQQGPLTAIL